LNVWYELRRPGTRWGEDERYLVFPLSADVLESLLYGIYFLVKVFVHVGFEHSIPVVPVHDGKIRSIVTNSKKVKER
jgi:hypothetical protein